MVGFQTGAKSESVSERSSSGPWIRGSGAIAGCTALRAGSAIVELRILVLHTSEVRGTRARAELVQDVVCARIVVPARDHRLLVVQRAEHDRLRRAGLLAGGHDLAVGDLAAGDARVDARALDA